MRIVSGGQTGVDRAALDVARLLGLEYGGWCPRDGWAEDLPEPPGLLAEYPELTPTTERDPAVRTRLNVEHSDATLVILPKGCESVGTRFTISCARELGRPIRVLSAWQAQLPWLREVAGATLNVAGPRESESPGVYRLAYMTLRDLLR